MRFYRISAIVSSIRLSDMSVVPLFSSLCVTCLFWLLQTMDIIINVIIIEYAIFFIITIAVVSVTTICSAVRYFPMQNDHFPTQHDFRLSKYLIISYCWFLKMPRGTNGGQKFSIDLPITLCCAWLTCVMICSNWKFFAIEAVLCSLSYILPQILYTSASLV